MSGPGASASSKVGRPKISSNAFQISMSLLLGLAHVSATGRMIARWYRFRKFYEMTCSSILESSRSHRYWPALCRYTVHLSAGERGGKVAEYHSDQRLTLSRAGENDLPPSKSHTHSARQAFPTSKQQDNDPQQSLLFDLKERCPRRPVKVLR